MSSGKKESFVVGRSKKEPYFSGNWSGLWSVLDILGMYRGVLPTNMAIMRSKAIAYCRLKVSASSIARCIHLRRIEIMQASSRIDKKAHALTVDLQMSVPAGEQV